MDLNDCISKGLVKKTRINAELVASLIEMSDIKEETVRKAAVDKRNIPAYVSMAYDALRETLEALCVSMGYKVLSHMCTGELLREKVKDFDYHEFDRFRYVRNGINYYGTRVDYAQGMELIEKMFALRKKVKSHIAGEEAF